MVIIKQLNLPVKYIGISFAPSAQEICCFNLCTTVYQHWICFQKCSFSWGGKKKGDLQNEHGNVTMGFFPLFKV